MAIDPRTPVLVGAAAVTQREDDPTKALEPLALMERAVQGAAEDAGDRGLLERAGLVAVPRGMWTYTDPARAIAERVGATGAATLVTEIGVLQTTLLERALGAIAAGRADVVLVAAAEAKHRARRGEITGLPAPMTQLPPGEAETVLRPSGLILSELEIRLGLARPVSLYAMIENALRASEGQALDAHRDDVARGWAALSEVASKNPDAWRSELIAAERVREATSGNPMLAFPYTRLHNSQWNVDQAAGLVLCSLETARSRGIPAERMVFPLAVAESNHMRPPTQRRALHRSVGFRHAGRAVLEHADVGPDDVEHLELYSCFPVAVRLQQREMGLDFDRPASVTGGMAFAGGPLNHFSLQALVQMARVLRNDPGSKGLVTAVSGILTKQGVTLWSTEPGAGYRSYDVSEAVAAEEGPGVEVRGEAEGAGRVASYTVLYEGAAPARVALLCDLADESRALLVVSDPELAGLATREELCGRELRLESGAAVLC